MIVEQYRPAYFTGFENEQAIVDTVEDLLNLHWIQKFCRHRNFHRFSISLDNGYPHPVGIAKHSLMLELDKGQTWWVIAQISEVDPKVLTEALPEWKAK